MRLYDTAKQSVVPFEPGPTVLMYTCGITPYDATHLGHAFTFISYDILIRRLIDLGHEVKCVRNVTDVDDPLFAKARELGVHYLDLAAGEEARFTSDTDLPATNTFAELRGSSKANETVIIGAHLDSWVASDGAVDNAAGVAVVIEARHMCMMMRGVEKQNSTMNTSVMLGAFRESSNTRQEFLQLIGRSK